MKILLVHNEYGKFSGEEAVVAATKRILEINHHQVLSFHRSSNEIEEIVFGKMRAFVTGIYNASSRRKITRILNTERPDVVHIHNLFPLISPSILPECRNAKIPIFMTVHNFRLICPSGLFMSNGKICEKCSDGKEQWCILQNCERSLPKSIGYALRNAFARKKGYFADNVTIYGTLTEFQRGRMIVEGFEAERIVVIPNMVDTNNSGTAERIGDYVGFVGRVSPEKDIPTLLKAAESLPEIPFKAVGSYEAMAKLPETAPCNFLFKGQLNTKKVSKFYEASRIMILCSNCYEGFPMVLAEAMMHGKPIICSRIGGLPEIVEDGVTGLLFEPGNAKDLAEKIRYLWDRPDLCNKMGAAGREKALREYSVEKYYKRLMSAYEKAISLGLRSIRKINAGN